MIGDHRVGDLLDDERVLWCLQEAQESTVRVRQHFARCVRDTEQKGVGACSSQGWLQELAGAAAATAVIDIEPCAELQAPCWLAEKKGVRSFAQRVVVRAEITTMANLPDVQAYLSEMSELDGGMDELISMGTGKRGRRLVTETPAGILQASARAMPIQAGLNIACEARSSKVLLQLQKPLGGQQFVADAQVCGTSCLDVGDVLHRAISAADGTMWRADVATVSEVLSTGGGWPGGDEGRGIPGTPYVSP